MDRTSIASWYCAQHHGTYDNKVRHWLHPSHCALAQGSIGRP
ncbi:hypothetical protein R4536_06440 [Vibrio cholerae]|nr:hypothetical protein [Vibrio cholerae]WOQ87867.1 hypothetical protein R4536_06440 [Vibrio cholerae]